MPLMQGKSKAAFGHNVGAEMNAGKPQNQALAIAYSVKRKNAKKMNEGGMVENEKLHPDHEPYAEGIVQKFFSDKMGYSDGGISEPDDASEDMEMMSESGDDFLTHENDNTDELAMNRMLEGMNESEDGSDIMMGEMEEKDMKKKKILQSIMDSLR